MAGNKSRLLRLYRYLYINTDDRHYTTKQQIVDAIRDEDGGCSRQTVRDDIETLSREGFDIETVVSSGNYYYFRDREFTLDELRLLGDAVASCRFIGKKQKAVLAGKLKGFCSRFQAKDIERHLVSIEPAQSSDARICEYVNLINDAVNQGRKIGFQYREDEREGAAKPSGKEGHQICTPLDLVWDGRNFYLAALAGEGGEPELFDLRRIAHPLILKEEAQQRPAGFKTEKFARERLGAGQGAAT